MTSLELRKHIKEFIILLNNPSNVLSEENIETLSTDYAEFILDSTIKYIRGKKEHGGNLKERNLDIEIDNELIDLFHYHSENKRRHK